MKSGKGGVVNAVRLNSWFWIAFIFFGQGLCSIIFAKIMKVPSGEIFLPISVLFLGGTCGLAFFIFGDSLGSFKWQAIVPALAYGAFIFLMSGRSFRGVDPGFDTSYFHPVEFATFGLLLGKVWYPIIGEKGFGAFSLRVIAAGAAFACSDEIHQAFVPGRAAEVADFMYDVAGILTSLLIIAAVRHFILLRPANNRRGVE